jgi:hypothetical protein
MFLEEVLPDKTVYMPKWVHQFRSEVHAHKLVNGERHIIGCVFIGTQAACNRYIVAKETIVPPNKPKVAPSQLQTLFKRSLEQIERTP